jgi:hypothetical protein
LSTYHKMWLILGLLLFVIIALACYHRQEKFGSVSEDMKAMCPKTLAESQRLWYDHVHLTRIYIVKYLDDLPDLKDATVELMRNQEDLGVFIDRLAPGTQELATKLLKEHIAGAVDILTDAKEGKDMAPAISRWYENADVISKTLAPALGLDETVLRDMMHAHLKTTLDEATYHLQRDERREWIAYCDVINHIMIMAEYLISKAPCRCRTT